MRVHGLGGIATLTCCALGILGCAQGDDSEANKALVRGYMEAILNNGDLAAVQRFFPDTGFVLNGRLLQRDDFRAMREGIVSPFPDFRLEIEDQLADGDKVVTRVVFRGTHQGEFMGIASTGRVVEYGGTAIDRIENGKVVEGWHQADQLGMLRQLGVLPER